MVIDAHQHYWKLSRGDYRWMTPQTPAILRQDFLPADLSPLLLKQNVDRTVLVQAADSEDETTFLLDLANRNDSIAGVVGWLDVEANDIPTRLSRYRKHPKFVGIRPMLEYLPDDYILRNDVRDALKELASQSVPLDILITARQLPFVLQALDRVPGLRAVIDHIAKPDIRDGTMHPWAEDIAAAAKHHPNLYCKLSGMITEADHQHWTIEDLRPYVDHMVECFGFDRLLFGSDWPVCLIAGSYDDVIEGLRQILKPHLTAETEAAVFGGNAIRFYGLSVDNRATLHHRDKSPGL